MNVTHAPELSVVLVSTRIGTTHLPEQLHFSSMKQNMFQILTINNYVIKKIVYTVFCLAVKFSICFLLLSLNYPSTELFMVLSSNVFQNEEKLCVDDSEL